MCTCCCRVSSCDNLWDALLYDVHCKCFLYIFVNSNTISTILCSYHIVKNLERTVNFRYFGHCDEITNIVKTVKYIVGKSP